MALVSANAARFCVVLRNPRPGSKPIRELKANNCERSPMKTPYEIRIAEENRIKRAVAKVTAPAPRTPLPDEAVIGERLAVHGKDSGVEARARMAKDLQDVVKQVSALRRNPTMNAAQIELAVADSVQARVDRLLAECEEQAKVTDTMEREVERGIEEAFNPPRPEWHASATEYRNALLDMDDEQRLDFIERLQGTRHAALLRFAIASVPPELSGVSAGVHRNMYDTTLALKDPALLSRPGDLRKRRAALVTAAEGIRRTAAELMDKESADALRALVTGGDAP